MRRRDILISGLAMAFSRIAISAVPQGIASQPTPKIYRLGFLTDSSERAPAFEAALAELGYLEQENLVIERRHAGQEPLPVLAAELVRTNVHLIVTVSLSAALAAKQATGRIPIVMITASEAIESGLLASSPRPGGNVTGVIYLTSELDGKRLDLLRELKPIARRVAFLGAPEDQSAFRQAQAAAAAIGMDAVFVDAFRRRPEAVPREPSRRLRSASPAVFGEFERAFEKIAAARADVLVVAPRLSSARIRIVELAALHRLPAVYGTPAFVQAGGLISYGTSAADTDQRAAVYVDKILRGAKPADLPVQWATKFDLVVNLKTARALGLTVPRSLLARADEVIG